MRVLKLLAGLFVITVATVAGSVFAAPYNTTTNTSVNVITAGNIGDMCNPMLFKLRFAIEEYILHPKWLPFIPEQTKLMWEAQEAIQLMNAVNVSMTKCPTVVEKELPSVEKTIDHKIEKIAMIAPKVNMTPIIFDITHYHDRVMYEVAVHIHNETLKRQIAMHIEEQNKIMRQVIERIVTRMRVMRQIRLGNESNFTHGNVSMNMTHVHIGPVRREIYRHFKRMYCIQIYNPVECNGTVYPNMCDAIVAGENPANCVPVTNTTHPKPLYVAIKQVLHVNVTPVMNMTEMHYHYHYHYCYNCSANMTMNMTHEHEYYHHYNNTHEYGYGYNYSNMTR